MASLTGNVISPDVVVCSEEVLLDVLLLVCDVVDVEEWEDDDVDVDEDVNVDVKLEVDVVEDVHPTSSVPSKQSLRPAWNRGPKHTNAHQQHRQASKLSTQWGGAHFGQHTRCPRK